MLSSRPAEIRVIFTITVSRVIYILKINDFDDDAYCCWFRLVTLVSWALWRPSHLLLRFLFHIFSIIRFEDLSHRSNFLWRSCSRLLSAFFIILNFKFRSATTTFIITQNLLGCTRFPTSCNFLHFLCRLCITFLLVFLFGLLLFGWHICCL